MIKNVMGRLDGPRADGTCLVTTDREHLVERSRLGRNCTQRSSVSLGC